MATVTSATPGNIATQDPNAGTAFSGTLGDYKYSPNGTGGVNYFYKTTPITNTVFGSATGQDYGAIEKQVAAQYAQQQQAAGADGTGGTGGTTGGTGGTTGPTAAQIQNIIDQNNAVRGAAGAATSAAQESLLNGPQGILNTISGLRSGQNTVDQEGVQANLAKTQGMQGVLNMVNHGLQSGGITLAHNNASNSSAAEALARAYGVLGRNSASQVGNQFAQAQNKVATDQTNQNLQAEAGVRNLGDMKAQTINQIVQNATQQLNYLNSMASSLGVTGQVDLAGEIQSIKDNALSALSQYDSQIAGATPTPMSQEDSAAKAQQLATAGTAATAPYDYTSIGPSQLQGTGPFASELPIFTFPGASKKTA